MNAGEMARTQNGGTIKGVVGHIVIRRVGPPVRAGTRGGNAASLWICLQSSHRST